MYAEYTTNDDETNIYFNYNIQSILWINNKNHIRVTTPVVNHVSVVDHHSKKRKKNKVYKNDNLSERVW